MGNRTVLDNDSSHDQAGFRHPASQTRLCRLCLATRVAYLMKQDTSRRTFGLWLAETLAEALGEWSHVAHIADNLPL